MISDWELFCFKVRSMVRTTRRCLTAYEANLTLTRERELIYRHQWLLTFPPLLGSDPCLEHNRNWTPSPHAIPCSDQPRKHALDGPEHPQRAQSCLQQRQQKHMININDGPSMAATTKEWTTKREQAEWHYDKNKRNTYENRPIHTYTQKEKQTNQPTNEITSFNF